MLPVYTTEVAQRIIYGNRSALLSLFPAAPVDSYFLLS
jgi:hypothetical protein